MCKINFSDTKYLFVAKRFRKKHFENVKVLCNTYVYSTNRDNRMYNPLIGNYHAILRAVAKGVLTFYPSTPSSQKMPNRDLSFLWKNISCE